MNTAQYAVSQLNDSSLWNNIHPDHCLCGGGGWISSAYDTWHRCSIHAGSGHPEDDSDFSDYGPGLPYIAQEYSAEILADFSESELSDYRFHIAQNAGKMAAYDAELEIWEAGAAEREIEQAVRWEAEAKEAAAHMAKLYKNATDYYRACCIEWGMSADDFDAAMACEDSLAVDGSVRAVCNGALSIFVPAMQEAQEAQARSEGYSGYSEMLWADNARAEQYENETNGGW